MSPKNPTPQFASFLRLALTGATCAALVPVLALVSAPRAAADVELGLQDDGAFLYRHTGDRDQAFDLVTALRPQRLRVIVYWNRIAGAQSTQRRPPRHYRYDFSQLDSLAAAAQQRGLPLQLVLTGKSPAYATADHRVGNYRPSPKLYAAWVRAVARRYAGRGYRYSIWNEPNYIGWLSPLKSAPRLYRRLADAGYRAIKSADPSAEVLLGELASFSDSRRSVAPIDFIEGMRCRRCARLAADGFAYHPYDLTHSPGSRPRFGAQVTIGTLDRLFAALDGSRLFRRQLPVYLTEWGYATSGSRAVTPARQAEWTAEALTLVRRQRRVRQLVQYGVYSTPNGSWDTGIATPWGSPMPAYEVLQRR
jgi:hypothetical protein